MSLTFPISSVMLTSQHIYYLYLLVALSRVSNTLHAFILRLGDGLMSRTRHASTRADLYSATERYNDRCTPALVEPSWCFSSRLSDENSSRTRNDSNCAAISFATEWCSIVAYPQPSYLSCRFVCGWAIDGSRAPAMVWTELTIHLRVRDAWMSRTRTAYNLTAGWSATVW